jgi:ankyrin repeat protein
MVSCYKGFYEIARMLLDRNADVKKSNRGGQSPFLFCFSRLDVDRYKYENKKICMMLIDLLLSKGANINIRLDSVQGYTVLMKLASTNITDKEKLINTIEMIKFLLERGADLNVIGLNGKNTFDVIVSKNEYREEILNTLKNTPQTIFYESNSTNINSNSNGKKIQNDTAKSWTTGIIIESNESRMNCCIICKIFFNYF